jgi:hypothetical protein
LILVVDSQRPPAFTGLVVHRDPVAGFSLLLPDGWQRTDLPDGGGTLYAPDPNDPTTGLEVSGHDLGTEVHARDLPALRRGFLAGLRQLPDAHIEQQEGVTIGALLSLEARVTYRDGEATRRRWVRLLYQGSIQVLLLAEGSTPERFAYWESMFVTAFRTVRFGDWWAEAVGIEWVDTWVQKHAEEPGRSTD